MKRNNDHRSANGHGRSAERVNGKALSANGQARHANGHSSTSLGRGGLSARGERAASDDEREDIANESANSSATDANRGSSAEAAASPRSGKKGEKAKPDKNQQIEFPGPTDPEVMRDTSAFVCGVAREVDFVKVSKSLLQSSDEKIRKATLDKFLEMHFGKVGAAAAPVEDVSAVDWSDVPRPPR